MIDASNNDYGELKQPKQEPKTKDRKAYMKAYHKKYYPLNKSKYLKKGSKKQGQRGLGKSTKYLLTVKTDDGTILFTKEYRSQKDIATDLNIAQYTVNRIYLKKYTYDKKSNTDKKLKNYLITKIDKTTNQNET